MNRPVLIHGVLLAVGLAAAYLVWTRDTDTTQEDEVSIVSLRGGLDRIVYSAPNRVVEVERKRDKVGSYHWAKVETVQEKPAPRPAPPPKPDPSATATDKDKKDPKGKGEKDLASKPAGKGEKDLASKSAGKDEKDPTAAASAATQPAADKPDKPKMIKVTKKQQFKGNRSADEMMTALSNLAALRSLGQVDKDKLEEFGLAKSKKTLTLISGSSPRTFIIGGNTHGNRDVYIQDKQDSRVYVVRPRNLQDLQYAEYRLVDRSLHTFTPADVDRAVLVAGKRRKEIVQKNRRDPTKAFWVDAKAPDKKKDFYRNFMSKLVRLPATDYVLPSEQKKGLTEVLRVEYHLASGKKGFVRLMSLTPPAQTPPPGAPASKPALKPAPKPAPDTEFFAVSGNTRAQVKINARLADGVVRDIDNLMQD